jgi:hypothetical protein
MNTEVQIVLNLYIALGNMDTVSVLIIPIHECGVSAHVCIRY